MASSWLKSPSEIGALSGSSVALLFWWQSLTPTLIPRSWETQVVVSAICLAVGYGIGSLAGRWAPRLLEWPGRSTGNAIRRDHWILLGSAWLVGALLGATLWKRWQDEQRKIVYLQHPSDPTVFRSLDALWQPPGWMEPPRGFDAGQRPLVSNRFCRPGGSRCARPAESAARFWTRLLDGLRQGVGQHPASRRLDGADTERLEQFIQNIAGDESEP